MLRRKFVPIGTTPPKKRWYQRVEVKAVSAVAALGLIAVLALILTSPGGGSAPASAAVAPASTVTVTTTVTASPKPPKVTLPNAQNLVNQLCKQKGAPFKGVRCQISIGTIDLTAHVVDRSDAVSFAQKPLLTQADIKAFFASGTPQSKATLDRVTKALNKAGYGADEVARAKDGTGYFPVQVDVAAQILGTSYFRDGKALTADGWRTVKSGDILWIFMTKDNKLVFGATLRGDCGNGGLEQVREIPPGSPAPPITCATSTQPGCTPPPPTSPPTTPPPTTSPSPTPTPCATSTTVEKCGKWHSFSPSQPPFSAQPSKAYTPPPATPAPGKSPGQGDSGPGAINTVSPPATESPGPAPSITTVPSTNPPGPPGAN